MSNRGWTFKKHVLLSFSMSMIMVISHYLYEFLIILFIRYAIGSTFSSKEAASIAIIGGADGPTAFFTTFASNSVAIEYIFFFLVLILLYLPIKNALNNAFRA